MNPWRPPPWRSSHQGKPAIFNVDDDFLRRRFCVQVYPLPRSRSHRRTEYFLIAENRDPIRLPYWRERNRRIFCSSDILVRNDLVHAWHLFRLFEVDALDETVMHFADERGEPCLPHLQRDVRAIIACSGHFCDCGWTSIRCSDDFVVLRLKQQIFL